ncbi:MAG: hypothetical protein Ct9H300mP1_07360 [Planctomycetaceae bacterium]|nr:MAG: hypothetical protein Ct9H300mP1_07360 [Planctomycetaceae bacterium]
MAARFHCCLPVNRFASCFEAVRGLQDVKHRSPQVMLVVRGSKFENRYRKWPTSVAVAIPLLVCSVATCQEAPDNGPPPQTLFGIKRGNQTRCLLRLMSQRR